MLMLGCGLVGAEGVGEDVRRKVECLNDASSERLARIGIGFPSHVMITVVFQFQSQRQIFLFSPALFFEELKLGDGLKPIYKCRWLWSGGAVYGSGWGVDDGERFFFPNPKNPLGTPMYPNLNPCSGMKLVKISGLQICSAKKPLAIRAHVANDPKQEIFREMLIGLREGIFTEEQWRFLMMQTPGNLTAAGQDLERDFGNATRLHTANSKVDQHNVSCLRKLNRSIARIVAINDSGRHLPAYRYNGLENVLYFAVGAQVSLTSNILPEAGPTNGALGYMQDLVYINYGDAMPSLIVVDLDDYVALCSLGMLNAIPAAACLSDDIHKLQGQTLSKAVVDIGDVVERRSVFHL
ncbi:hypothetical protein BC829DRAFT_423408 [Chytridium lagenaria]|nr:hypothetical protein BC829DRAFT_423408 [Chytridium lagenaria]